MKSREMTSDMTVPKMAEFRHFSMFWDALSGVDGAREKTRTSTPFRAPPPEDGASTNSATRAPEPLAIWPRLAGAGR